MKAHIKLGRVFGVELGLHYSWFIIAGLITLSLAAHFREVNPVWGTGVIWAAAILTGVLFFAGLFAHELSHAAVAKVRGLPIHKITLFMLGGAAQIEKEASDATTEFLVAIAGPISSALIGGILLLAASLSGWAPQLPPQTPGLAILVWLGYINLALAAFNMIPGFPLDGGRVLRALIWWISGDGHKSTRIAAGIGQAVGVLFIAYGVFRFLGGAGINGIWMAFIGWFLLQAAAASRLHVQAEDVLEGLRVGDVMTRDCDPVAGGLTLQQFVDERLLRTGGRCFVVVDNGHMSGLITPHEVRQVDRSRWTETHVRDAMRKLEEIHAVSPSTPAFEAMELMAGGDVNQLPVMSNGHLEGVVSRGNLLQALKTRAALAAS